MKYIVVGLGNFGASLAEKLTKKGNEVIGIDNRMDKVEFYKEKISHTIRLDATDETTVAGLPIKDTDTVIIAIGEKQGVNVMATALFKNLKAKRLISRAINPLHEKVLEAIGVDAIVHPEEETAERWAKKLSLINVKDSFELGPDYSVIEVRTPNKYVGKNILEIDFRSNYNLVVLTVISENELDNMFVQSIEKSKIHGVVQNKYIIQPDDILVLFGTNENLKKFIQTKKL